MWLIPGDQERSSDIRVAKGSVSVEIVIAIIGATVFGKILYNLICFLQY